MSKISIPEFDFKTEPTHTVEFTAKKLIDAYIKSLQGDREPMTKIEKVFAECEFFNAIGFKGRKICFKVRRTSEVYSSLLHSVLRQIVSTPTTKVMFCCYDAPGFDPECNKLHKNKVVTDG